MINKRKMANLEEDKRSLTQLFSIYIFTRIIIVFMIIPSISLLWNRKIPIDVSLHNKA